LIWLWLGCGCGLVAAWLGCGLVVAVAAWLVAAADYGRMAVRLRVLLSRG